MTDELELSGELFRPGGPIDQAYDDPSGPIDVSDMELAEPASDEAVPRSLVDEPSALWPATSGIHASLVSVSSHIGTAEAWQSLVEELAEESRLCDDPALRSALVCEAGRILIERLGRQEEGELLLRRSTSPLVARLRESHRGASRGLAAELATLEQTARDTTLDPETRAAAWIEFGLACEERTGGGKRAFEAYERAIATRPEATDLTAHALAAEAALALGDSPAAMRHLEASLPLLGSPQQRAAALLDLGEIADDPEARVAALQRAHREDPSEETVLRRYIRALSLTGERARVGELYRELARVTRDPISASTALHLGFLTLAEAGKPVDDLVLELAARDADRADATDVLAPLSEVALYVEQRIAAGDDAAGLPENAAVLARLWRCLDDPREQALVREQLARIRLAEILRALGPGAGPDTLKSDPQRAAITESIAADLRFCLVHLPEHRGVREALAVVLRLQGNVPSLVLHLQEWARTQTAGPDRAAILLRLGQLHEELGRDIARAAEIYELAAAEDPENQNCQRALGQVYEKMRRWSQAAACLRRQIDGVEDEQERLTGLRRLASIAENELGDIDLAISVQQEITALAPNDLLALYELARLSRNARRPTVLVSALELLADRIDDDIARTGLLVELGEVQELHLKQRAAARACYERALALSPGYTPALRALARLYRDNGELEDIVRLLRPEVDPITDPALLALKTARVYIDEIGDVETAIGHLQIAYRTNPDLVPARELLLQLLTASSQLGAAYDLLRAQDVPKSPAAAADHHYRLGLLAEACARRGGGPEQTGKHEDAALQHYRAALVHQSDHGLAFERSRRILVAHHDLPNLVRLLEDAANAATGQARSLAHVALARAYLADQAGLETARRAYEQAFEATPGDPIVRHELEVLLRLQGDRRSLPALYLRSARDTTDKHLQATLLVEAAELLLSTGEREDHDLAGNAILDALRVDPGNPYAVRHLERLLTEPDSPFVIKDAVSARAVRAQSDAERAIFYVESAELLEKVGAWGQARRAYLAAKGALPQLAPADLGLARLATEARRATPAAAGRQSIHVLLAEARDAAVLAARGDAAARIRALTLLAEILTRDAKHRDAITLARSLATQVSDPTPVVELLEQTWQRLDEPTLRYELALFLAEHSMGLERAVHYYEAAAATKPTGRRALRGLVHTYRQMGDDRRAAIATERLLELFDPSEPAAVDLRMGIATFLASSPETLPRALDHARIVLDARPDEPRAMALMAELLDRAGQPVAAAELLERLAGRERNREKLHDILLQRARLLSNIPGQQAAALDAIERAASLNPGNRETVALFVEQLEAAGQTARIESFLGPIRNAVHANISRGAVSLRDLVLLAKVASRAHPGLSKMATHIAGAIEPGSERSAVMRAPSPAAVRSFIDAVERRGAILAEGEPPALHTLLAALDGALGRLAHDFPIVGAADIAPLPRGEGTTMTDIARRLAEIVGARPPRFQASATHNTVVFLQDPVATIRLGSNLWNLGDEPSTRGLVAVAFARLALGAPRARALPPAGLDLLLAAAFEVAGVFNPITADPDPRVLSELVAQLRTLLPRRHAKSVEDCCRALASHAFEPGSTARAIRATDLHLATLLSSEVASVVAAACSLDGVIGGSLKQRINRSRSAQELLSRLLADELIELAMQLGAL
jgi:tetratricopeptide (TPR) repeat protein